LIAALFKEKKTNTEIEEQKHKQRYAATLEKKRINSSFVLCHRIKLTEKLSSFHFGNYFPPFSALSTFLPST